MYDANPRTFSVWKDRLKLQALERGRYLITGVELCNEVFSFHLMNLSLLEVPRFLLNPVHKNNIPGLNHSESFFTMSLGEPILSAPRYHFKTVAFFAWWQEASFLDEFLQCPSRHAFADGWHVQMKLYRRWGEIAELRSAVVDPNLAVSDRPMVAVTLARLKLSQTLRFARWGKPVESQVRDHKGQSLALAALRPIGNFSTFSIWKNESEMINMVHGKNKLHDGESHRLAMQERMRKDFHHEFTTLRFTPIKEIGVWNGKSDYTLT